MRLSIWHFGIVLVLPSLVAAGFAHGLQDASSNVGDAEEKILQAANLKTDNESLMAYLRVRTVTGDDRAKLEKLVQDLDSDKYAVRVQAAKDLKERGRVALPFLKRALKDATLEMLQRAKDCIRDIESKTASEPTGVVARLLALRGAADAVEALFDYLPNVDEANAEEEILSALGLAAIRGEKVHKAFAEALKGDNGERRGAAIYALAQRGGVIHRDVIRLFLADPDIAVRNRTAAGLLGKHLFQHSRDNLIHDLATLRGAGVDCQGQGLLDFLAKRTLSEGDQKRLQGLVKDLGHKMFAKREKATKALIDEGVPALPFLRAAVEESDAEMVSRARLCIKSIQVKMTPAVPAAVVRILALSGDAEDRKSQPIVPKDDPRDLPPAKALETLLAYLPFAEDETIEEEAVNAILVLSTRAAKTPTALPAALSDELPARRGAAALALAKVGTSEQVEAVKHVLNDPVAKVRFRAAQGLIAAQDKAGVQPVIDLLAVAPDNWLWQVDEQLNRVAGGLAPTIPASEGTADYRVKAQATWNRWWKANVKTIDLASLGRGDSMLGIYTITEIDSQQPANARKGRVWECGRDGKPRWEIDDLFGAMDSHVLPNGRVLVTEANNQRVTERDLRGNIFWTFMTTNPPVAVQRLPNGNTFICTYDRAMEVTPAGQTVYDAIKGGQYLMYGAQRMKNGHVAAVTAQGKIIVFDPVGNRDIKTITLGVQGGLAGIDVLPNGHFLVAMQSVSQIREIDDQGKIHWKIDFPGVSRAVKLPNGNVLASSTTTRRVAELDRNGAEVWGVTCRGRPWSVKFR